MDHASDSAQPAPAVATAAACIAGIVMIAHQAYSRREISRVDHNGCNDPNCLRCHSNSSHHMETFRRNATLLRRLVKLEPEMFEGMRSDIWTIVDEMENCGAKIEHQINWNLFDSLKYWLSGEEQVGKSSNKPMSTLPLSPQIDQEPTVFFLPKLEAIPLHHGPDKCHNSCPCLRLWKRQPVDPKSPPIPTTGDIEMLQKNFDVIRFELDTALASHRQQLFAPFDSAVYTTSTTQNNQSPEWSSIYLIHQGVKQSACHEYFPHTTNIIETQCPNRMAGKCGLGSIYFSKLRGNTKVKEHCGPTNVRWRCHIPLIVPSDCNESRLCVGVGSNEEKVGWREATPILFDDSFLHSAVHVGNNHSSKIADEDSRIVLIIDFWHPALSEADRNAIGVLYPPGS